MTKPFSFDTINQFDDHIEKSIPGFNNLIYAVKSISEYFYNDQFLIYDLGCSTGKLLKTLDTKCKSRGYDICAHLLPVSEGDCTFNQIELNQEIPFPEPACIVYSIFTMQFLNPLRRESYIQEIYDHLIPGGAFIIAEKTYLRSGKIQEIMTMSHYDMKLKHFTAEEILTKERDLRLIMHPTSTEEIEGLTKEAGFRVVIPFWQMFNFKAWLCVK